MAIETLDELLAGFQAPIFFEKVGGSCEGAGILHSFLYSAGVPGAAAAPASAIAGDALTSYAGQLPFANPVSGNAYMAGFKGVATTNCRLLLLDRLWHNSGIDETDTGAQTVNSTAFPARDANGETDGEGVLVGIEVSTATTNAGAVTNTTLSYTNSDGTSGRTATIASFPATAVAGTFVPFQLASGDKGVRSIQSLTLGTNYAPSGTPVIHLVAYRVLAELPIMSNNVGWSLDAFQLAMPRLYDNSVPFLVAQPSSATAITARGMVHYAHG